MRNSFRRHAKFVRNALIRIRQNSSCHRLVCGTDFRFKVHQINPATQEINTILVQLGLRSRRVGRDVGRQRPRQFDHDLQVQRLQLAKWSARRYWAGKRVSTKIFDFRFASGSDGPLESATRPISHCQGLQRPVS